ncbi:KH domain-containing protein HEN4 isoform X1 [Brassica napus]|uniref:K Homology domain-containing protein n=1 Tax=Brassica oleracea var. oleracea TaxID=109376 RepID=A0A0D3DXE8_BRAOL|nr:PREDICTED: KH domain-containing protein At4g18375 isoform X1 [Brassica oleracea var. oleracea]XP_013707954.1 KH domain-containing protein HEN4 isoform X1 [Brassica napus]
MASTLRNIHGKRSNFQSEFPGNGGSKRRNLHDDDTDHNVIGSEDTVYRYLCPVKKTGSIIGKGGEIAKQIRSETKSNMRINETLPGCEERVVTIYSTSDELNHFGEDGELVCPALDALFKVHDMVVADTNDNDDDDDEDLVGKQMVTVRMLVPSDQIGCVIGKGGQVIQKLRTETNAQIRVIKDNLPPCALTLSHDELLQIIGEPLVVREALYQVASLLHDNPSRFQHSLLSSPSTMYQPGGMLMCAPLTGSHRNYTARRDLADSTEFCVCFICPAENVGGVIGKGGGFINQIRQETGATIRVNTSETEEDDSIIFISSKEFYEDQSPTVNAAIRLQERCSEKVGKDTNDATISTRLLVSSSHIGCLIGKGGAVISEMRSVTRANIRILQKENVPKIAREDEEMVQITGSPDAAMKALTQVILRLRANAFDMNHGLVLLPTSFPYIPQATESSKRSKYAKRDGSRDQDYSKLSSNSKRRNYVS